MIVAAVFGMAVTSPVPPAVAAFFAQRVVVPVRAAEQAPARVVAEKRSVAEDKPERAPLRWRRRGSVLDLLI